MDLVLGDPRRLPHPVAMVGRVVGRLEKALRVQAKGPASELAAGWLLALLVIALTYASSFYLIKLAQSFLGDTAAAALNICLAYTTLSVNSLAEAAREVITPLEEGDLSRARRKLSMVVGRDTQGLDGREVSRGAVETVAENASDGIIAPLIYMAIGGAPLALAYKAVNTMDSMLGYRDGKYLYFGRAAARLDDIANFVPARLTALLMVAGSFLASREGQVYSWRDSWRVLARDRRNHPSPNSGWPEAAAAGALRVRLGGESSYSGVRSVKPYIGDDTEPLTPGKVRDAVGLMYVTAFLGLAAMVVLAYFRG